MDGDGIPDEFDRLPDDPANACWDFDGDLLIDLREYQLGTDPSNPDSDGDGLADGEEVLAGLDPSDPDDALGDGDKDGFPGWYEARRGTNAGNSSSRPPMPAQFTPGRYVRFLSEESPAWLNSFAEIYDLNSDGSAVFYARDTWATGSWTEEGAFIKILFEPGQVLSESFPWRPELGRQTQRLQYIVERTIGRSDEKGGRGTWIVLSRDTESFPELEVENELVSFSRDFPVARTDTLAPAEFEAGVDYQIPCRVQAVGGGAFNYIRSCGMTRINDELAWNGENDSVGLVSTGSDGELVIDFSDMLMSVYIPVDFGGYQRAVVLIQMSDGSAFVEDGKMTRAEAVAWPEGVAGIYQYPWSPFQVSASALVMRTDGLAGVVSYQPSSGEWTEFTFAEAWKQVDGQVRWERYMVWVDGVRRFVTDPSECEVLDCRIWRRRILEPVVQVGDELLVRHTFETYDSNVSEGPDVLQQVDQGLRALVFTPFYDLTFNGIPDSIDPDIDEDGLPDEWERRYFHSDSASRLSHMAFQRGQDDPDGDGFTNLEEYLNGWHPMMPTPNRPAALRRLNLGDGASLASALRDTQRGRNFAYRLDSSSGSTANTAPGIAFGVEPMVGSALLPDMSGDGVDELAVLLWDGGPVEVRTKSMGDGALVSRVFFDQSYQPSALLAFHDMAGGLAGPAVGVLGTDDSGRVRAQVKNARTGQLVSSVWFDRNYAPLAAEVLPDMTGNGAEELAVLGMDGEGRVRAQIKDASSGALVSLVFFDRRYRPLLFAVLPDVDGNGFPDIGVLGRADSGEVRLQVKDALTGQVTAAVRYESGFQPHAIASTVVGGNPLAAVLARNPAGLMRLQTKSLANGAGYSFVQFDSALVPKGLVFIDDISGNGIPEAAVLGLDRSDRAVIQVKDVQTGAVVRRSTIME
jgi:hypothetical protein